MVVSKHATICEECLETRPAFSKVRYYGIYEGTLREAIHLLKFGGIKRLAKPLAVLAAGVCAHNVDAVVPVPLSKTGLIRRGFNQTAELGRHIASLLKIDMMPDALRKTVETLPQTEVSGRERLTNVRGAFAASGQLAGMRVLLVDDVITTGATVRECSKVLLKAGAAGVTVVAPARSIRRF
jgi:ComF family protein